MQPKLGPHSIYAVVILQRSFSEEAEGRLQPTGIAELYSASTHPLQRTEIPSFRAPERTVFALKRPKAD